MLSYTILHVASGVSLQAIGTYMYVTSTCLMVINNFKSTKGLFYYGSEGEMNILFYIKCPCTSWSIRYCWISCILYRLVCNVNYKIIFFMNCFTHHFYTTVCSSPLLLGKIKKFKIGFNILVHLSRKMPCYSTSICPTIRVWKRLGSLICCDPTILCNW